MYRKICLTKFVETAMTHQLIIYWLLIAVHMYCTSWWHLFFLLLENWKWHYYAVAISCHSRTVSTDLHFDPLRCSYPWLTFTSLKEQKWKFSLCCKQSDISLLFFGQFNPPAGVMALMLCCQELSQWQFRNILYSVFGCMCGCNNWLQKLSATLVFWLSRSVLES